RAPLPLVETQQAFLIQQRYFPTLPCNVFLACTVHTSDDAPLDRQRLGEAFGAVVGRHRVLRSVVARERGAWVQRLGGARPSLTWVDRVDDERVANEVLDLEQGPLMRIVSDGHRVALQAHHLLVDAWSAKIVVEELLAGYAALSDGTPISLPEASPDWWTASPLVRQASADAGQDECWRERLDRLPPLPLPWDGDPGAAPQGPARMLTLSLSVPLTRRLEAFGREHSVTLAAVVLAGYAQLLFDVSGQHDQLIRVAMARRDLRLDSIGTIVGSFADSVPVRIALQPDEEPGALARRVQAELVATRRHEAGASSIVLAKLGGRSAAGPAGLTPAGFSFVNLDAPASIGSLRISDVCGASASGFTRLGLIGWTFAGQLGFSFNYLDSLFHRETVAAMAARAEEIFAGWASPRVTVQTARRLDGELVRACERFGVRPLMPGLTYAELAQGSAALAARLSGPRIAVLADPGPVGTMAILAILRAGATYVPLDPDWPDARIRSVLDEAKPEHLLTGAGATARAARLSGRLPVITVDPAACAAAPAPALAAITTRAPAYIMFTSGSTGRPKGVVVGHASVLTLLDWVQRMLGAGADDCFLQSSALTFGASLRQTFAPILIGAPAVPLPPHTKKDPATVLDALAGHQVTILNCVPSVWSLLMDEAERQGSIAALAALRWLLIGGEAVPLAYWRRWRRLVPAGPRVANLYGGAETIANVTWFEVPPAFDSDDGYLPIGWPRYGMRPRLEESGELVVSGAIADGYLNSHDQGFVTDPRLGFSYRTGDLARLTADGEWLFLGRRDHRVQIHGNRVELGEIEAALCQFDGVGAARVDYRASRLSAALEV
ncbi:MAG: AMP-binding protein, partial [Vicinamibacterales bacterium]|nr:AMP-binding protein [Vicinamibacterales bacterium]